MEANSMDDRSWKNEKMALLVSSYQVNSVKLALVEKEWKRIKMLVKLLIDWLIKSMLES